MAKGEAVEKRFEEAPKSKLEPFELIAARKGTEKWQVAACAAYHRWAQGKEVTEAQFDEAVEKMLKGSVLGPA